jgi:hypothetical protein
MVDIKTLLPDLKRQVTELSEDLLARSTASAEIDAGLREAYTQIEKGGRTADAFEVWREDYLDQVAVAWVLGCVFVRYMEDNHLIDECWLAGESERRKQAEDTHELYFREHPRESDREYFEHVFHEVGKIPACHDLFAEGKTPLWAVGPSGDAAMKLLAFWREIDTDSGQLKRTFDVEDGNTRFLGDLYQDLSERARKKYALLQTPVFVEEFILDRTLNPAIDEFGLDEVRMIDPTCGSGHFLLGGFARLFDLWIKRKDNDIVAAQKALDGVWGCDINPFAVAIARFRLIVAALRACEIKQLKSAPAWNIHLATGDSLLFGNRWDRDGKKKGEQQFFSTEEESWAPEIYACEDKEALSRVLGQQYHAVVGNPPYITVKDKGLNQAYRDRYSTCHRQYSLAVPFAERFFELCLTGASVGYLGKITANSFMKREFGKKLIEEFLPKQDLTHVVDTSGAYIPCHGTPTVILFGRNRPPQLDTIRAVLGITGEPTTPADPAEGVVWQSIIKNIDVVGSEDEFTSAADIPRTRFSHHPWSIGGGSASEIKEILETDSIPLKALVSLIGFVCMTRADDVYFTDASSLSRANISPENIIINVEGGTVRDWAIQGAQTALFPYDSSLSPVPETNDSPVIRFLWPYRSLLWTRREPNGDHRQLGLTWYEWSRFQKERFQRPLSISYANVATHNHFAFDRGGKVFNRSAPIIKLEDDASQDEYLYLLGILNSSAACFWMKQVFYPKATAVGDISTEKGRPESNRYDFAATGMLSFPIPNTDTVRASNLLEIVKSIDLIMLEMNSLLPDSILTKSHLKSGWKALNGAFASAQERHDMLKQRVIALQEELDWEVYRLYGLSQIGACEEICANEMIGVQSTARPFLWGNRKDSDPVPPQVKEAYSERRDAIQRDAKLRTVETPVYKRPWWGRQGVYGSTSRTYGEWTTEACRKWLLNRLEHEGNWTVNQQHEPRLQSVAMLADKANSDQDFMQVAVIYRGREDFDFTALIAELVEAESVPFLSKLRYKSPGLRKRVVWEKTWELQRKEDAGEDVGEIKVPPKYTSADFQKSDYWRLRGKLDVPKEHWISFPHCETEGDPSLVVGWAGWNHLQQGTAIVSYYDARKNEGWTAERLTPLLVGLDQLLPWIHQWHPEIDPEYNETAGTSFQTLLESEAQELGLTLEQIRNWTPPAKKKSAKKKAAKKPRKKSKSAGATEGE